jgi:hypothetical protein
MPIQRFLVDTGNGLFVNYVFVLLPLPQGWQQMPVAAIPGHWPRYRHANGEWVFFHPALVMPQPQAPAAPQTAAAAAAPNPAPQSQAAAALPASQATTAAAAAAAPNPAPQSQAAATSHSASAAATAAAAAAPNPAPHPQAAATPHAAAAAAAAAAPYPAAAADRRPKTVQDLIDSSTYVPQDDRADHYSIGKALAYTYNLSDCSALALYHPQTGLSYLRHADTSTKPADVQRSVNDYLQQVIAQTDANLDLRRDIQVTIFVPAHVPNKPGTSLNQIRRGIAEIEVDQVTLDLFQSVQIAREDRAIDREHYIIVGGGAAPSKLRANHPFSTFEYVLRKLCDGKDENTLTPYGETFLKVASDTWSLESSIKIVKTLGPLLDQAIQTALKNGSRQIAEILDHIRKNTSFQRPALPSTTAGEEEDTDRLIEAMKKSFAKPTAAAAAGSAAAGSAAAGSAAGSGAAAGSAAKDKKDKDA